MYLSSGLLDKRLLLCFCALLAATRLRNKIELLRSEVERGALPSPARPVRKSHATEGNRLRSACTDHHHQLMMSCIIPYAVACLQNVTLLLPITHTNGLAATPFHPPEPPSLRCHPAALTLVLQ